MITRQLRRVAPIAVAVYAAALAVLALFAVASELRDRPFGFYSREPSEFLDANVTMGALAHIGVLVWWGAGVAGLIGGFVLWRAGAREAAGALLAGGAITMVFAFDDLLRIHEGVAPTVGIPKRVMYGLYLAGTVAWLWAFRDYLLRRTEWLLLAAAFILLSFSVAVDVLFVERRRHLLEDGAKFLGIATWALYFVRTSLAELATRMRAAPAARETG